MTRTLEEIEKEIKEVQEERSALDKRESQLWRERQKVYDASIESIIDSKFKVGKSYVVFQTIDYHCDPITIIQLLEKNGRSFKTRKIYLHFYDGDYNVITTIESLAFKELDYETQDNVKELTYEQTIELVNKLYAFDSLDINDVEKEVEEIKKQYAN